jgi:hypothetical protein
VLHLDHKTGVVTLAKADYANSTALTGRVRDYRLGAHVLNLGLVFWLVCHCSILRHGALGWPHNWEPARGRIGAGGIEPCPMP